MTTENQGRVVSYELPEAVVERGALPLTQPFPDRRKKAREVLVAALSLSDDPVERIAEALYENEGPGSFVDVPPSADYPDGQKWVKWPAWDTLGTPDADEFPDESIAALDHYRDSAEVALQALGLLDGGSDAG